MLTTITPRAAVGAIADALAADLPIMLWGPPGVGKSDLVRQVAAAAFDGNLIDIRLSQYDPAELGGLPVPDAETKTTSWYADRILPGAHSPERGILFLDEITSAPPMMQAAAYQMVLDRGYRGHKFPPGWAVMAAGNRTSDRGVSYTMPSPLANRMAHLQLDPSDEAVAPQWVQEWCEWASSANVNPIVLAFIMFRPQALFTAPRPGEQAFPTPRAWSMVARHLDTAERQGREPNRALILGTVGAAEGTALLAFLQHRADVPTIVDIIADPMHCTCPTVKNIGACFFMLGMIADKLNATNAAQVFKFLTRLPSELESASIGMMPQRVRLEIGTTTAYTQWIVRNQSNLGA